MQIRELRLVYAERDPPLGTCGTRLTDARGAVDVFVQILGNEPVEVFGVLCLTTQHAVIGYHELSRGVLDATVVHPREVFKAAILSNASAIIVGHNHPSGDPTPSHEDVQLTLRLRSAASLMGIPLLDHLIIGEAGRFHSFRGVGEL